jgi:hypothetical protein
MSEAISFDEDKDPEESPLSKGWRAVPSRHMDDFLSWAGRYYRNIESLKALDYDSLQSLLYTYVSETGETTYSLNDWVKSLQRYI